MKEIHEHEFVWMLLDQPFFCAEMVYDACGLYRCYMFFILPLNRPQTFYYKRPNAQMMRKCSQHTVRMKWNFMCYVLLIFCLVTVIVYIIRQAIEIVTQAAVWLSEHNIYSIIKAIAMVILLGTSTFNRRISKTVLLYFRRELTNALCWIDRNNQKTLKWVLICICHLSINRLYSPIRLDAVILMSH